MYFSEIMPLPTVAAFGSGLARAGMWVGSGAFTYYGVKTSFSPKMHSNAPYRYLKNKSWNSNVIDKL